jgi:hypothetical protein
MPPPASTPSAEATPSATTGGKPQSKQAAEAIQPTPTPREVKSPPKQAEEATPPRPHRKAPATKTASTATEPEKKATSVERRAPDVERRGRSAEVEQYQRRERVYRDDYAAPEEIPFGYRGARPYAPPPVYGQDPGEMGPVPFAPPWYYRNRSYAWGPYPGMGVPRGPW